MMSFDFRRHIGCFAKGILALVLFSMSLGNVAGAAKFPNAVEKKVLLRGQDAVAMAKLLGFSSDLKSSLQLPLGRSDSWAVYLLKKDAPQKLLNSDQGMPERSNNIEFSPAPDPSISIGVFWLDQSTALPNAEPGVYSFSSPWMQLADTKRSAWAKLINSMQEASGSKGLRPLSEKSFHFDDGIELTIQLWINDAEEYAGRILVKNLPAEKTKSAGNPVP